MNETDHGPVFVICRNRRAATEMKKLKLPKGSKVVVDPCTLDNYMSQGEIVEIQEVAKAKEQMGVN